MPLDVRIISGGSTYYLVNSSGSPTAGGSATGASTTPYSIQAADWTLTAAPRQTIYAGGPPFRVGSSPLYSGYGNVTETLGIGIMASSANNMAELIRQLRRILNTALYDTPAVLYWLPTGATSPTYFEIYSADVQEVGDWNNPAAGFTQALVNVTIMRGIGGRLSSGETLLNAVTFNNTGTGGTDNLASLGSSGAGDLVNDGQPLNVQITPASGSVWATFYAASVTARDYVTSGVAGTFTGLAGGGVVTTTGLASATTPYPPSTGPSQLRVLLRGTGSSNAQVRAVLAIGTSTTTVPGPWVTMPANTLVYDLGAFSLAYIRATRGISASTTTVNVAIQARSLDGSTTSVTVTYAELLTCYTFASVVFTGGVSAPASSVYVVGSFPEVTNRVAVPHAYARGELISSTGNFLDLGIVRGTAPRYYPGASLYLAWQTATAHSTSATATITATQAPLYQTLRGNA